MINAFPKLFNVGTPYVLDVFNEPVEITEKIDGSQFAFGLTNDGQLIMRSKSRQITTSIIGSKDMFASVVSYVSNLSLPRGIFFYCEYMRKPKHNCLAYQRTPLNGLCLFGVQCDDGRFLDSHEERVEWAGELQIDTAPVLAVKKIERPEELIEFLEIESYLGGVKIEGVVVKNYHRTQPRSGRGHPIPFMGAKHVSDAFREVQKAKKKGSLKDATWDSFMASYRTEARWRKAIQHLREDGTLTDSPKDIGPLVRAVQIDIIEEEEAVIRDFLWKTQGRQLLKGAIRGLPEFYKNLLLERAFAEREPDEYRFAREQAEIEERAE